MATSAFDSPYEDEAAPQRAGPPLSLHPAFPAIVALWFAALLGLGSLVLPAVLLEKAVSASGLASLVPEVDRTNLNGIIYEELCRGIVREESRRVYVSAIEKLAARGAEAVILGCTEITMLIDDSVSPLPVYDTTDLHARALVSAALS